MPNSSHSSTTRFLESIAIRGGKVQNLYYHQQRMLRSAGIEWEGADTLLESVSPLLPKLTYKLRLIYSAVEGIVEWSVEPYEMKSITALRLVKVPPSFDYHLKYANRSALNEYSKGLSQGTLPLFVKNGMLTDTSYTNLCLRKKGEAWVTPNTPLLSGTMRESLLNMGLITEQKLSVEDLPHYDEIALINAMIPLGKLIIKI